MEQKNRFPLLVVLRFLLFLFLFLGLAKPTLAENVSITALVPETTATLSGFAPASSVIFIKEAGLIVGSTVTDITGHFSRTIISNAGQHTYVIYLIDDQGRSTPEVTLPNFTLTNQVDLPISNINLPPTIAVTKTKIAQGQLVAVFGEGSPGSSVDVYVNGTKKFTAVVGNNSSWEFDLNGGNLADQNSFYSISRRSGLADSEKSQVVSLEVLSCSDSSCNRQNPTPPNIATAEATPKTTTTTPTTEKPGYTTYNFKIEIGKNLSNLILLTSMGAGVILFLIIFLILLLKRARKRKNTLEELEKNVEKDLQTSIPVQNIRNDFDKTAKDF